MRNPEESVRQFVDQRYPSVIISETELKKDYGKQIADGDIDPASLSFEEWLFNQMEAAGGTLSHYVPPEPEWPEFSVLIRETFVLRVKVKAKSYLEAMEQVEEDYNNGYYVVDNFADVEFRPCCSCCESDFDENGGLVPEGLSLENDDTPQAQLLCDRCLKTYKEHM